MKKFLGLLALGLTILHTNDLHAHVEPFLFRGLDANRKVGRFANITTYVKSVKEQEKGKREVLFLDAGDYFTGPYISSLTEGEAVIDIMNTMGFDAATIGNHEFDHGWENGREKLKQATFPLLLGNVYEDKTDLVVLLVHQVTPEPIKANDTLIVSTNGQISQVERLDSSYNEKTGKITFGSIISAAPFLNELTVLDLTGARVETMFEHTAGLTNRVLQVSSEIIMTYDPEKEVGKRIT